MARRRKKDDEMNEVVFARMHDKENLRYIYNLMVQTKQPMREIVERMVEFCRGSSTFVLPVRTTTAEKLAASEKARVRRLKQKAAGVEYKEVPKAPAEPEECEHGVLLDQACSKCEYELFSQGETDGSRL